MDKYSPDNDSTSDDELFKKRVKEILEKGHIDKPVGIKKPKKVSKTSEVYERSPKVTAWLLQNSDGNCELCMSKGFKKRDGDIYLEVHHVKQLNKNGSDRPENAVAVCPNCHKYLHYGENAEERIAQLYHKISRLVKESTEGNQ